MNEKIHPKRLRLFIEEIYKNYPETENNENYRFYYLYTDYQEEQEFLLVIVSPHALAREAKLVNESIQLWNGMFGFKESTILSEEDFQRIIETQVRELQNTIRGTKYTSVFYEVW